MSTTQKEASCLLDTFKNPMPLLFHLPLFWYLWYRNLLFLYMLVGVWKQHSCSYTSNFLLWCPNDKAEGSRIFINAYQVTLHSNSTGNQRPHPGIFQLTIKLRLLWRMWTLTDDTQLQITNMQHLECGALKVCSYVAHIDKQVRCTTHGLDTLVWD